MFLCGVADAFARGVEGKLRFAARGAWPHGPAAWRENSASLRAMRWQHGPRCGRKTSLCCVWCAGSMALRRGGKTPCFCAMRWQHGPAAWRENSASLRAVRGRTALRCGGKIPCCCAMRWPHGLQRGEKVTLCCRAVRWPHGLQRGEKVTLCCRAVCWPHGLRNGKKASLCCCAMRGGGEGKNREYSIPKCIISLRLRARLTGGRLCVDGVEHSHVELRLAAVGIKAVRLLLHVVKLCVAEAEHVRV